MTEFETKRDFWIKLLVTVLAFPFTLGRKKIPNHRKFGWGDVRLLLLVDVTFFGSLILGVHSVLKLIPLLIRFFEFLSTKRSHEFTALICGMGALLMFISGVGLYVFKRRRQLLYGLVEMVVACASGFYTLQRLFEDTPPFLGILAAVGTSIYFIQRGFANFVDGSPNIRAAFESGKWLRVFYIRFKKGLIRSR